jgi:hypothetical protein
VPGVASAANINQKPSSVAAETRRSRMKKKVVMQLIGIQVFKPLCGGIELSYLIDGVQKTVHVSGTHYTDVSLVESDDNTFTELDDRELAKRVLALVRSIAEKWEEFRDEVVSERNRRLAEKAEAA